MSWIVIGALAVAVFCAIVFAFRLPRGAWELVGAALLLGLSGYALQGRPGYAGSPTPPRESREATDAAMIEARRAMGDRYSPGANFLITADALARQGQFAAAAGLLRGAARQYPDDPDLWVAMGNALVGHAGGAMSPAALHAFRRAAAIAPDHPGPPFFTGLAFAQAGDFAQARRIWQELAERPGHEDAPWRADLLARIARLDALMAMQRGNADRSGPLPAE